MSMNKEESNISEQAKFFIKMHQKNLIEKFASLKKFPPSKSLPATYFMAGSPGAGKTEFSKKFINLLPEDHIVRIDADEIKILIPQYNKKNSDIIQGAASLGVEKLYDFVLKHKQNALVDGTLANYKKSEENIQRSLEKNREIHIFYLSQNPLIAWDFTQKREELEGRNIPKEAFIETLFLAKESIKRLKGKFPKEIFLHLILKNNNNLIKNTQFDVSENAIDSFIKIPYTKEQLKKQLCSKNF
ncbi:MAG: hypothetical protein EOM19_03240 [Candidatus Moranbacteria bacterium]|nr:hypothetical protein [Candidatus Moranbacteria bacterium]